MRIRSIVTILSVLWAISVLAQTNSSMPTVTVAVPTLVRYSGTLPAANFTAGITFALYKEQTGGAPLWLETQNVTLDGNGRYTVNLGTNHAGGIPAELFAAGEARWLGVQAEELPEQPRVLLVSVPYAMKAADADTLGGLPASAYVTADQLSVASRQSPVMPHRSAAPDAEVTPSPCTAVTSDGTALANYLTKFTAPCNIEDSGIYQSALATTPGFLGIGTTAPVAPLDMEPAAQTGTSGGLFGVHVITNFNPTGNSTGNYYAFYGQSNSSMGNATNFTGDLVGSGFLAQHYGTGTVTNLFGANYSVQNRSTGTVTNAVGFFGGVSNLGAGTITNGYGLQVPVPQNSGGGVFTNFYGVYIANPTGITNSWGLYSLANTNYMSGKLGINVTAPTQALEINGNLKFDTAGHGITYADGTVQTTASLPGSGTITKVTAGTDLTGGGSSGAVTLNLNTAATDIRYARLAAANAFTMAQAVTVPAVASGAPGIAMTVTGGSTGDSSSGYAGGAGLIATGGTNTADPTTGGGTAISASGGPAIVAGSVAGAGIIANGGIALTGTSGGIGIAGNGSSGDSSGDFAGGWGVVGNGGSSGGSVAGASGIVGIGGASSGSGNGGDGISGNGGTSHGTGAGGPGGIFNGGRGGSGGGVGGLGILVSPGTDNSGNPSPAGIFDGQIWVQSGTGLALPQAYLEQTTSSDYARLRFFVDSAANYWDIAVGGGANPPMNFFIAGVGNVMSLTPGGAQYMLMANGALLTTGGVWTNNSDRNLKEDFTAVNGADLLARLQAVPMSSWKYKSETGVRHLGPMAQDFYAAFGLGNDDKHIGTVDEGGVALAAIQELYRQGLSKDAQIRRQQKQMGAQQQQIETLSRQVAELNQSRSALAALESRLKRLEAGQQSAPAANHEGQAQQAQAPSLAKAQLRSE